jgi:hypothetical protein
MTLSPLAVKILVIAGVVSLILVGTYVWSSIYGTYFTTSTIQKSAAVSGPLPLLKLSTSMLNTKSSVGHKFVAILKSTPFIVSLVSALLVAGIIGGVILWKSYSKPDFAHPSSSTDEPVNTGDSTAKGGSTNDQTSQESAKSSINLPAIIAPLCVVGAIGIVMLVTWRVGGFAKIKAKLPSSCSSPTVKKEPTPTELAKLQKKFDDACAYFGYNMNSVSSLDEKHKSVFSEIVTIAHTIIEFAKTKPTTPFPNNPNITEEVHAAFEQTLRHYSVAEPVEGIVFLPKGIKQDGVFIDLSTYIKTCFEEGKNMIDWK